MGLSAANLQMQYSILHQDPTMYCIAPSLAELANGDILLAIREAHDRRETAMPHVDPTARNILFRSVDRGMSFQKERVIDDETHRFSSSQDPT